MTALGEMMRLTVFRHRETGVWTVPSRELARVTAHRHYNITTAARKAERELGMTGALIWGTYVARQQNKRIHPCCWIPREVLAQMRLNNLAGCRIVPQIIEEYLRLLDMHEAAQPAWPRPKPLPGLQAHEQPPGCVERPLLEQWAERPRTRPANPAPDTAIRPPDPEPAETLVPAPPWQVSWRITEAIDLLTKAGAPDDAVRRMKGWNDDRRWRDLQERAKSWADVDRLYREHQIRDGEARH